MKEKIDVRLNNDLTYEKCPFDDPAVKQLERIFDGPIEDSFQLYNSFQNKCENKVIFFKAKMEET